MITVLIGVFFSVEVLEGNKALFVIWFHSLSPIGCTACPFICFLIQPSRNISSFKFKTLIKRIKLVILFVLLDTWAK